MDAINATSQCIFCEHFEGARTCEAFPDLDNEAGAIPLPIFDGEFDHRQPWPGDHGIRWEPKAPGTPCWFPAGHGGHSRATRSFRYNRPPRKSASNYPLSRATHGPCKNS